jgi:outer membrane protein OmpA-like peptidoglycan-associated protein
MKKRIPMVLSVTITVFCFSNAHAQEALNVSISNQTATIAYQVLEENKLLVSALDAEENPIRGLKSVDFVVERAGKKARILSVDPFETSKEVGLNIVLVVDNSFSMLQREAVVPLLEAMEEFFKMVRPIDNIHLVVFDKERSLKVKKHGLHAKTFHSNQVSELRDFLTSSYDHGLTSGTFLYEAMVAGIDLIRKMPEKSNKFLVVFSDGEDLSSSINKSVVGVEAKDIPNFEAYCVDYMPGSKKDPFLKRFAEMHGGHIWKATSATELLPIFKAFTTTLLHRYVINYNFPDPPKGTLAMEPVALEFDLLTMTSGEPVRNYIFFETGKSEIPDQYVLFNDRMQAETFDDKTLTSAWERYFNVLNIIGKHLAENPSPQIKIVGCNSNKGEEKNNLDLSMERAKAVKKYFETVWQIDPRRMDLGARNLPPQASDTDRLGGPAENRRVEIEYGETPLRTALPSQFIAEANRIGQITIRPQILAEYGISSWELTISADSRVIKTFQGKGELESEYAVSLDEFDREDLTKSENLRARIKVADIYDDTHETAAPPCPIKISNKELIHALIRPPYGPVALEPDTVVIEELTMIDSSPMLNYIFFDTGKSDISERYVRFDNQSDTKTFSESKLKGTMEKYVHVLNIIGKRLLESPEAGIRIVGCNSDFGAEQGRIDLSRSRADEVRAYLKYIWGVDSSRMKVDSRNLPAVPTTNKIEEGRAENQRVEIHSDFAPLLEPIKSTYVEEMSVTKELRVVPKIHAGYGVARWKVQLAGDGALVDAVEGSGALQPFYIFDLNHIGLHEVASFGELTAEIEVADRKGQVYRATGASSAVKFVKREERLARKIGYKVLEKYALILFDFDSSDIKERNKAIVDQIIERMQAFPSAEVKVFGHTDTIGTEDYNLKLSEKRAKAVYEQILAGGIEGMDRITYAGAGPYDPLYDNKLPEGRALNRTVTVSLEYEREK